jgi:hypothetical protein
VVAGQGAGTRAAARTGEAVVRVRPRNGLLRVEPRCADALGQLGELIAAALADGRERYRVPGQLEGDLIRLPSGVPASYRLHG